MPVTDSARVETRPDAPARARPRAVRVTGPFAAALFLLAVLVLSLAFGAKQLSPSEVWHGLTDPHAPAYTVVRQIRLPRTLLGLLAGAALGLAGGLMQALTRNPLADPGLLGINAGAASAVVSAISFFGITSFTGYVWFAFAGAGAVSVVVWAVGGGRGATPVRLALAGTAVNAVMYAYVNAVQLLDTDSLDRMRFWTVGSLASARPSTVTGILPFVAAGTVLALLLARPLNALALGEESANALGARPARTRAGAIVAVTLLCGAATAACGPIVFVGLMVPHVVRVLTGPDLRLLLPYCALLAPTTLLGADVLGRVLARPSEVQVGIVTAVLGGPFFLHVVRRGRWARA
ncbi:FecCD family ABC transporter permease [Actinoallomurus acaciae]|uniref:FecCD family ABC transporter permease n=1 Tax=Actinoallomurus acaciae TaxID=502577 RepID=A0ABV5YUY2_9ACTN